MGDYENAVHAFEKCMEIYDNWGTQNKNPFLYYMLGNSLHKVGNHKREKEIFDIGLELYPDHLLVVQGQAICALSHDETRKAEQIMDQYVKIRETVTLCPSFRIEVGLGSIYAGASMYEDAEKHYRKAYMQVPDEPEFINELAFFLIDYSDDPDKINEGLVLIEKALDAKPDHWLYLDTKAWGLHKIGKDSEALPVIKKSWENRPGYNQDLFEHLSEIEKAADI